MCGFPGADGMSRIRVTVEGAVVAEVEVDREIVLGRAEGVDIRVADSQVSSRHLRIRPADQGVLVADLGSTNGSVLDEGTQLQPNVDTPLARGQKLMVGPALVEVVETARPASDGAFFGSEKTMAVGGGAMQAALINVARFKAAAPRLVVGAEHDRRVVPLQEMEVVVGREAAQCQVEIRHASVSSAHASISYKDGAFVVTDLGSSNGTFVDGNRITGPTTIQPETAVTFGTVDCLFACNQPESEGAARLSDALAQHIVAMRRATQGQVRSALDEHRKSGRPLGEVLVERGVLAPRQWVEIWRQRDVISTLGRGAATGGAPRWIWLVVAVAVLAVGAIAALVFLR